MNVAVSPTLRRGRSGMWPGVVWGGRAAWRQLHLPAGKVYLSPVIDGCDGGVWLRKSPGGTPVQPLNARMKLFSF